jgi:hypothetical protein
VSRQWNDGIFDRTHSQNCIFPRNAVWDVSLNAKFIAHLQDHMLETKMTHEEHKYNRDHVGAGRAGKGDDAVHR